MLWVFPEITKNSWPLVLPLETNPEGGQRDELATWPLPQSSSLAILLTSSTHLGGKGVGVIQSV